MSCNLVKKGSEGYHFGTYEQDKRERETALLF